MRKFIRFIASTTAVVVTALFGTISFYDQTIPDHYYVHQGEDLQINSIVSVTDVNNETVNSMELIEQNEQNKIVNVNLFGIIPIKQTKVSEVADIKLVPGGTPFGIKLLTEGVLIVGLNSIDTAQGLVTPAKDAGLEVGDTILSINGNEVSSNSDISEIVKNSDGKELAIEYKRDGQVNTAKVKPVVSSVDQKSKVGIWVRDSSAGIGTITFYQPESNLFAGLGHAVCDVDTGEILPISYGEIVPAEINGITKGSVGTPGSLKGMFLSNQQLGEVLLNTDCGVFGTLEDSSSISDEAISMALKQEVHTGTAKILCTIEGTEPKEYEIQIDQIDLNEETLTKNLVIRVTDEELIEKTGGIVQGMSGSPIIQDGKLVGAVTHVFVNDPTKGYGIFAENMLNTAQELNQEQTAAAA